MGLSGLLELVDDMGSPVLFRLGMVNGDLVNFDLTSGGTGEPDRDWLGEAPALLVPPLSLSSFGGDGLMPNICFSLVKDPLRFNVGSFRVSLLALWLRFFSDVSSLNEGAGGSSSIVYTLLPSTSAT